MSEIHARRIKQKKYVRIFLIFNAILALFFGILVKFGWVSFPNTSTSLTNVVFWSGAIKHAILLSGIWIFVDIMFAALLYYQMKLESKK